MKTTTANQRHVAKQKVECAEQWRCTCVIILGTFLCCPPQNNNVKWPNSALSGERERQPLIFQIYIPNLTLGSIFSFEVTLTVRNDLNNFCISHDSYVQYNFLADVVFGVAVVVSWAPSTLIRFQTKTELFCSGYGYRPHYNAENDHRKRCHLKSLIFNKYTPKNSMTILGVFKTKNKYVGNYKIYVHMNMQ